MVINEISPSTDPEWVELFNDNDTPLNLTGYLLEDGNSDSSDDVYLSGTISPKGFLVFTHAEGWLNNSGDTLKLYNNASPSAILDQTTFGSVDSTKSFAKIPNGGAWQITTNVTNGVSNPTPTPSPTPTPTQIPSPSPTPTSTKTPTPTPVKTKTPSPTPTPTPSVLSAQAENTPQPIAATEIQDPTTELKNVEKNPFDPKKKVMIISIIIISVGILITGVAGFLAYKKAKMPGEPLV